MTIDDIITVVATPRSVCCLVPSNNLLSNSLNRCNFLFTQFKIILKSGCCVWGSVTRTRRSAHRAIVTIPQKRNSFPHTVSARAPDRRLIADAIYRTLPVSNPARREAKIDERRRSVSRTGGNE